MFDPFLRISVLHMFFATLETSLFVVGGLASSTYLKNGTRHFLRGPLRLCWAIISLLAVLLIGLMLRSLGRKTENTPFIWTLLLLLSFIGLGLIVFPYIIPTKITIYQGAAAPSSLVFMLIFVGFLIPIMLFYNIYQYVVFRGKVSGAEYGE